MPFNGSGVFQRVRNWVADAAAGIKIRADYHDAEDDGFAAGLSNCITKDGQTVIQQNIPFNNRRIINLGAPVNDSDAATKRSAYDSSSDKVFKLGDTMTGNLTIHKSSPVIILDKDVLGLAALLGQQSGAPRWAMYLGNDTNETGGSDGSDFVLLSYDDAGALVSGNPVLFGTRKTGLLKVKGPPTEDMGIVNKKYLVDYPFHPLQPQLFPGIPLVIPPSWPYTPSATDAQKAIVGTGALILPTNTAVPYPMGTCITFIASSGNMTIQAGAGDTLYWQDGFTARTGTRTMLTAGIATVIRTGFSTWVLSGSGMS
jgi:hypothetical protein